MNTLGLSISNAINNIMGNNQAGSILNKNLIIRNVALMHNTGKYSLYNETMYPEVGMVYNFYEKLLMRPKDIGTINGLIGYNNQVTSDSSLLQEGNFKIVTPEGSEQLNKLIYTTNSNSVSLKGGDDLLSEVSENVNKHLLESNKYLPDEYFSKADYSFIHPKRLTSIGQKTFSIGENGDETYYTYSQESGQKNEAQQSTENNIVVLTFEDTDVDYGATSSSRLIQKTNQLFKEGRIKSIIGSYYSTEEEGDGTKTYLSRGRNLLAKGKTPGTDAYSNPYCRVWTINNQYHKLSDTIRPFKNNEGGFLSVKDVQNGYKTSMRPHDGASRLGSMGVLKDNGLPNITPHKDINGELDINSIKRCMFSIENLAWKDILIKNKVTDNYGFVSDGGTLSEEQIGPNGGRIMWFPPYNLKFSEDISTQWNPNTFIGRGENIYSYVNTERGGSLSFTLLIDHPSMIDQWRGNNPKVDKDNEDTILRFFAGCETLEGEAEAEKTQEEETKLQYYLDTPKEETQYQELKTFVFFPNNFTGKDMEPSQFAEYLYNGKTDGDKTSIYNQMAYYRGIFSDLLTKNLASYTLTFSLNIGNTIKKLSEGEDKEFLITLQTKIDGYYSKYTEFYNTFKDDEETPLLYYISSASTMIRNYYDEYEMETRGHAIYTLVPEATTYEISIESLLDTLTTQKQDNIYDPVLRLQNIVNRWGEDEVPYESSTTGNTIAIPIEGKYHKWHYKIDEDKKDELLRDYSDDERVGNNWDKRGFCLNNLSAATSAVLNKLKSAGYISNDDVYDRTFFSYKDLYEVLEDISGRTIGVLNHGIIDLQENIIKVVINAYASSHGNEEKNKEIANRRAESVLSWIREKMPEVDAKRFEIKNKSIVNLSESNGDVSSIDAKLGRAVDVTFYIVPEMSVEEYEERKSVREENKKNTRDGMLYSTVMDNAREAIYDNEYQYFSELSENDSALHSKIVEKIKYFDPAYHSITPEGFNARLTFLNQCTRQGPTRASSDENGSTSVGNLAFGRAPYCVLRIGDFYNTKILIDSVSINYDSNGGIQWDLNPEGAGVQPMMADVQIRFKFIGGSDISGPIERLQNAVSFNYYGNSSIYDRRADYRKGFIDDSSEEKAQLHTWSPELNKE